MGEAEQIQQMALEIRALREGMIRIETKLDDMPNKLTDHEVRLRALEKSRWPLPSIAALVSIIALAMAIYTNMGK